MPEINLEAVDAYNFKYNEYRNLLTRIDDLYYDIDETWAKLEEMKEEMTQDERDLL